MRAGAEWRHAASVYLCIGVGCRICCARNLQARSPTGLQLLFRTLRVVLLQILPAREGLVFTQSFSRLEYP